MNDPEHVGEVDAAVPEPLTHAGARALLERYYELLNERDVRHIPTLFTEDIVFQDDAWPTLIRGHAEMERFLAAFWRAMPDFRFELLEGPYISEEGRAAAVRARAAGTMTGTLSPPGFAPTGSRLTTEFGAFYEFEGDRVKKARIIANLNGAGVQLGAAPAPGGPGERLVVLLQHINARLMRSRARDRTRA